MVVQICHDERVLDYKEIILDLFRSILYLVSKQNSSDLNKLMLSEVTAVVHGGLLQFVMGVSQATVVVALILMLAFVNFTVTISICLFLIFCYLIVYLLTRSILKMGTEKVKSNERFSVATEGFGSIKELKAYGLEKVSKNSGKQQNLMHLIYLKRTP